MRLIQERTDQIAQMGEQRTLGMRAITVDLLFYETLNAVSQTDH